MRGIALVSLSVGLSLGCAVGPNYVPPQPDLPDVWHRELTRGLETGDADLRTWWTALGDPVLDRLIQRASAGNLDLRDALARVDEARARRGVARGDWFPALDGTGAYSRNRLSESTNQEEPPGRGRTDDSYMTGFDASWELDVFGRVRRSVESADANLLASVENYRDVLVILYADVARNYVDVRTFQERVRLSLENVKTQTGSLSLTRDRNRAGLVGDLDVRQAELNLASTEAFVPLLRQQLAAAVHRLGVLLGEHPSALDAELSAQAPIPLPPERIRVNVPADLVRQRPDIRTAERTLAAETAQIGVATADLYPRFSLLGTFAFDAVSIADWIKGGSISYGFGPAFRWSLFDGGRIRSNIEVEDAQTERALVAYEQTVLNALEDVENSITFFVEENERRDDLQRAVTAASEAVKLVNTLYRTGLTDFQNVLDTERSLFLQQDEHAASQGAVTQNLIRLYRSLGGGWSP